MIAATIGENVALAPTSVGDVVEISGLVTSADTKTQRLEFLFALGVLSSASQLTTKMKWDMLLGVCAMDEAGRVKDGSADTGSVGRGEVGTEQGLTL